ncbi:unnamed protein product [Lymnaea stagnalis]|uniref:Centriolar and ciliogenesis-associated protein HYLS1 C-terminal domain-containing protein n=1 Tax=Lymnaea stagnalis TaxID=6523 RepID=A0AAV2HBY2_LYMST
MEFTDNEIREELARLGYKDVPEEKLAEFKKDLIKLINTERSKSNSLNSSSDEVQYDNRAPSTQQKINSSSHKGNDRNNQGSPLAGTSYKEDWQYRGGRGETSYKSLMDRGNRPTYPRSYSLYEMPIDIQRIETPPQDVNNCLDVDQCSEAESETTKNLKRKICRKTSSGERVVDESFSSSGVAGIYEIYEKIKNLAMRDCECGKTRSMSTVSDPPYRIKGVNKNPSVIKMGEPPHTRNLTRTVPFKRHQMYQKMWKAQPAIGDDFRHRMRKEVHSKMLQKDDIKVFHKVFVPNPYVVPTEKPRYDLRWSVRKANALYEMPPHGFYHEI